MELENLIDFGGTADWRRGKYKQYPEDHRNLEAAEMLDQLAAQLPSLEGSELHMALEGAIELLSEDEDSFGCRWIEMVNDQLRDVGFRAFPRDAASFVRSLVQDLIV